MFYSDGWTAAAGTTSSGSFSINYTASR